MSGEELYRLHGLSFRTPRRRPSSHQIEDEFQDSWNEEEEFSNSDLNLEEDSESEDLESEWSFSMELHNHLLYNEKKAVRVKKKGHPSKMKISQDITTTIIIRYRGVIYRQCITESEGWGVDLAIPSRHI